LSSWFHATTGQAEKALTTLSLKHRFVAQQFGQLLDHERMDKDTFQKHVEHQKKADEQHAKKKGLKKCIHVQKASVPKLEGSTIWIDPAAAAVVQQKQIRGVVVQDKASATAFIVQDILEPPQSVLWHAALSGLCIMSATCFGDNQQGPWMQLKAALHRRLCPYGSLQHFSLPIQSCTRFCVELQARRQLRKIVSGQFMIAPPLS
jgi:hypothetical protein